MQDNDTTIQGATQDLTRRDFLKMCSRELTKWFTLFIGLYTTACSSPPQPQPETKPVAPSQSTARVATKTATPYSKDIFIDEKASKILGEEIGIHLSDAMETPKDTEWAKAVYPEQAVNILKFAILTRELLKTNKASLTSVATFTDFHGKPPPPKPPDNIVANPLNINLLPTDRFISGHFGPQEFNNLQNSRLTRVNLALLITISLIENGRQNMLFERLIGKPDSQRRGHWDAFNAHTGRDAGRYLSGITNSQQFEYGPDSFGGILATGDIINSLDLNDRIKVMFQPIILTLRCLRFSPQGNTKVENFEATDPNGRLNENLLKNYYGYGNSLWISRLKKTYQAFFDFCKQRPEYNWLLTESIV